MQVVESDTQLQHRRSVLRVIGAMYERLDEEFALEDMARVAYMSPFHLNRTFRRLTGVPPCRFLTAVRLGTAKRLLLTSELSVTDISLEVGYNSLGTFIRRFTELVGVSPGHFRKLASSGPRAWIRSLRQGAAFARSELAGPVVTGRVEAPQEFRGPIFVGLFRTAVPQSRPLTCTLLTAPGTYRLTLASVEEGSYHLFTAGMEWSLDPHGYLLGEQALRGCTGQRLRIERGFARGCTDLALRPPKQLDPPILLTLPLLVGERLAQPREQAVAIPGA